MRIARLAASTPVRGAASILSGAKRACRTAAAPVKSHALPFPHGPGRSVIAHMLFAVPRRTSDGVALCREQVVAQQLVEVLRPLLGEENPRTRQLERRLRSRDRLSEPMSPLPPEVDVIRTPDDEGWSLQLAELRFDQSRVLVVESHDETLQVACTLLAPHQRPKIGFDVFVRDGL